MEDGQLFSMIKQEGNDMNNIKKFVNNVVKPKLGILTVYIFLVLIWGYIEFILLGNPIPGALAAIMAIILAYIL